MAQPNGLRVTVQGDLPDAVMKQIASAVRKTVLAEVATIDLLRDYRTVDLSGQREPASVASAQGGATDGIVVIPPPPQ